jgi:CheY-like chemotaxis protein
MKHNTALAKVLVASDNTDDAAQLVKTLRLEMDHVRASVNQQTVVADFEGFKPDVLVLAFDSIEKAQGYSLGLYRQSPIVSQLRHRTVLLCTKSEVRAAFDLCKQGVFDDYVLYWPMSQDGSRLMMSVWNAARETLGLASAPSAKELAAHAKQLGDIDALLREQRAAGEGHGAAAITTLKHAEAAVGAALDELSRRLTSPGNGALLEVKDVAGLLREFDRLKKDRVSPAFEATANGIEPVLGWLRQAHERIAPQMAGVRGFVEKVRQAWPAILVVEDDEFARKLIAKALAAQQYELVFANDSTAALALLRRTEPELILMDVNLPDMDGVALTRKLKAVPHLAHIPVLMLTGEAKRETLASSMNAGADGFIVKPFTREALVAKIERFLRG